ncbi:MAG: hypothetical protein JO118_07040, partial [Acetobacteraceae bacterium]|nr:hypothetical protein [Acetobacteraceae bacterium]
MKNSLADEAEALGLPPKQVRKVLDCYRVESGKHFRLKDHDPGDTAGHLLKKEQADALLTSSVR